LRNVLTKGQIPTSCEMGWGISYVCRKYPVTYMIEGRVYHGGEVSKIPLTYYSCTDCAVHPSVQKDCLVTPLSAFEVEKA